MAAFGCTLGVIPHMVAAITGLAAILSGSAIAFQTIKWLGVAYLLYLPAKAAQLRGQIWPVTLFASPSGVRHPSQLRPAT
ncbi:LysE family transporter [Microbacterium sp. Root553]|uniref:LysE family transporter n=1 Tax=Microbacterium sp. Root553 TaxID=1736556 RepID=UPI00190FCC07